MKPVSASEKYILNWIWDQTDIITSRDIISHFTEVTDWRPATISTFLSRLADKGYLRISRRGRTFEYFTNINRSEFENMEITRFLNENYNGSVNDFILAYFRMVNDKSQNKEFKKWIKANI